MRIAVIGAGAIGNLTAGYLKLKDEDVYLVGRRQSIKAIKNRDLEISGVRGNFNIRIDILEHLIVKPDLVILAVKTQDLDEVVKNNLGFLKNTTVLTVQNGVQADKIVAGYLPKDNIISSIVMFGATYLEPGKVMHNFEGNWILGKIFGENNEGVIKIKQVLEKIFPVVISDNIVGMKYLKIFVNANNCIAGILGISMQEAFNNIEISKISMAIWKEGLDVVLKAGINLVSLPDFPLERLTKLTSLPLVEAAGIFSEIMVNLSREPLYGSILQSIKRNRTSEIDYINGEFVNLAKQRNLKAPLNERLIEMVHQVEKTHRFFSKEELINNLKGLLD